MDISLERRGLSRYREVFKDTSYCELSADCVVPDTQGDILKILKCTPTVRLKSKEINSDSVEMSGELSGEILYVPESGVGISVLSFVIPFENETHIRDSDCAQHCVAELSVIAADVRLLNPRKVSIKAELQIKMRCYTADEMSFYPAVAEKPEKLFCKCAAGNTLYHSFVGEKQLSLDEELPCDWELSATHILSGASAYFSDGVERVGSKLIFKGHADISVLVQNTDGQVATLSFTSPFSQLFELSAQDDVVHWDAVLVPTAEYYSIGDGGVNADLHALIQLVCCSETEIGYIEDAYFCGHDLTLEHDEITLCKRVSTLELTSSLSISYDAGAAPASVLFSGGRLGRLKISGEAVSVPASFEIVYASDDGELCSARVRGCFEFALPEECLAAECKSVILGEISTRSSGNGIEISASAALKLECTDSSRKTAICGMSAETTKDIAPKPSLYLCRCKGRNLWSLAKAYGSSEEAIISANKLDDAAVSADAVLLIPRI